MQDLDAVWVGDVCGLGLGVEVDLSTEQSCVKSPMGGGGEAKRVGVPAAGSGPGVGPHHSLVGDLFGVPVEKSDFDRLAVCRHFFLGAVGEDDEAISIGQNLLGLK